MRSSEGDRREARARAVSLTADELTLDLVDGRTISVPLAWYPRLWNGSPEERAHVEILADGAYLHWPDLDEDVSVEGIVEGRRSGESSSSLKGWLAARASRASRVSP
jgi:hypothetical protein